MRRARDDEAAEMEQQVGEKTVPIPMPIPVGVFPMTIAIPSPTAPPANINPFAKSQEEWRPSEDPVWNSTANFARTSGGKKAGKQKKVFECEAIKDETGCAKSDQLYKLKCLGR